MPLFPSGLPMRDPPLVPQEGPLSMTDLPVLNKIYRLRQEELPHWLEPKIEVVKFPNPTRFPPPVGTRTHTDGCGCLITSFKDARQGTILLETIWQPLWWTAPVHENVRQVRFFNGFESERDALPPGSFYLGMWREDQAKGPVGSLVWPKKFTLWEIELTWQPARTREWDDGSFGLFDSVTLSKPNHYPPIPELRTADLKVVIGEKNHLLVSIDGMYRRLERPNSVFLSLVAPLYLPSVQNFYAEIMWPTGRCAPYAGEIRCTFHGYLHREIP